MPLPHKTPDTLAAAIIKKHALGSAGAMLAIPVPGADFAATYAVWAKMIVEISRVYGEEASFNDAKALASELFRGVILTTAAWFGSAKTAAALLKFIPGAGTVVSYLIDAGIAAFGARKITSALGFAAAAYYKSGKTLEPRSLAEEVRKVLRDPRIVASLLSTILKRGGA